MVLLVIVLLKRYLILDPAVVPVQPRHHDVINTSHVLLAKYEILLVDVEAYRRLLVEIQDMLQVV